MRLDFDFVIQIKNRLTDQKEEAKASKLLASLLDSKTGDFINHRKAYEWAEKLDSEGFLDLDRVDLESLEKFIDHVSKMQTNTVYNQITAPLANVIISAKSMG